MSDLIISDEARRLISKWTRDEFYVYIRPITSRFIDRSQKHKVYWQVSVEYRRVDYHSIRGEGYDLNQIILDLGPKVPRRKVDQPNYIGAQEKPAGKRSKKTKITKDDEIKDHDRPRKRTKPAKKQKADVIDIKTKKKLKKKA